MVNRIEPAPTSPITLNNHIKESRVKHAFMEVYPRGKETKRAKLYVIHDSLEVNPDTDITVTDLFKGKKNKVYKHFFNKGLGVISFKCSVIIDKNSKYGKRPFYKVLGDWINNGAVLRVASKAIDIPNAHYIITKNSARKQGVSHYTVWDLEFTQYREIKTYTWKNNNETILTALKQSKAKPEEKGSGDKNSKGKGKTNNALNKQFSKCALSHFKYGTKGSKCVKYLQKLLQKNKLYLNYKIDGHYGPYTKKAVAQYQKKKKLKTRSGKMDKATFNKLSKS